MYGLISDLNWRHISTNYIIAEASISVIYLLFPGSPKNYDMVFIYLTGILVSTSNPQLEMTAWTEEL